MTLAPPNRLAGRNILLVDDDPNMRRFVGMILKLEGADCRAASSGEEALDMLAVEDAIHLVILDLDLPGMSGWEVLTRLSSSRPEVKTVILTGNSEPDVQERSLSQGAMGASRNLLAPAPLSRGSARS